MRFPLLAKAASMLLVVLLIQFVLLRVDWLLVDRRAHQQQAVASVEQSLAGAQTLLGPLVHRRCTEEWDEVSGEGKDRKSTHQRREFTLTSAPQSLTVDGDLRSEPRRRGLFKVNGYAGTLRLQAAWATLAALRPSAERSDTRLHCGPLLAMLAVSDVRGLRSAQLALDGEPLAVEPGSAHPQHGHGLHATLPVARSDAFGQPLKLTLTLELIGTARLALVPAAAETRWALRSDWPHPSFVGRFLPAASTVRGDGFDARWEVSALASPAAADVAGGAELCHLSARAAPADPPVPSAGARGAKCLDTLGVAFIDPVNPYVLTDRATKYALLFVVLTFGCVALTEVLARRRVHPVQYTLVGLALAMFYLLLLSLSEHIAFSAAYAAASAACVALLGHYAAHMLGSARAGALFGGGVALLYGALWVLLQMEQTALVIGTSMLFAVLSAVMVLTRRLDWYALFDGLRRGTVPAR